jgi:hypothetical protein
MTLTLPTAYQLTRPPRDDDELYQLVQALWGVVIPRGKHCPHHQAPFDAFATAFFAREPQVLVRGSRGLSGKTAMMSCLGITQAVVLGADNNIVGGSEQQAINALAHMKRYWDYANAPSYMIKSNQASVIKLHNNAEVRPLTASERSVRGPHPARLLLDEIDEMDANILESAKGQPMPQKNWIDVTIPQQTTMVSTLQYADGTMMKEMQRFEDEGLPVMEWCYLDTMYAKDGWLSEEFVEQKKREVSKERWRVEYELGEPSIGNRAFDSESVEKTFSLTAPEPKVNQREYEEYEYETPQDHADYVIAADWAQAVDKTVITVWDVTEQPIRCVYYVRFNRRPYPFMIGKFNTLQKRYNADGIHDATGLGRVVADLLDGRVRNFIMAGRERDDMLSEFVSGVENDKIRAPRIGSFYRETLYCSVEDLYARGKDFHLPDSVCSAALAWKLVSHKFPVSEPVGLPKTDTTWMARQIEQGTDFLHNTSGWKVDGDVRSTETEDLSWSLT